MRFPRLPDVEDIAQIAFAKLWRRQSQPDSELLRFPKAALFSIARNAAIDEVRHQVVAQTESVAEIDRLNVLDEGVSVPDTVNAREELNYLADCLRELPTRCRQVLTLTKIYGLTEKQAAERLGISENTVRTHVVRGMLRCTDYLRRRGIERNE